MNECCTCWIFEKNVKLKVLIFVLKTNGANVEEYFNHRVMCVYLNVYLFCKK